MVTGVHDGELDGDRSTGRLARERLDAVAETVADPLQDEAIGSQQLQRSTLVGTGERAYPGGELLRRQLALEIDIVVRAAETALIAKLEKRNPADLARSLVELGQRPLERVLAAGSHQQHGLRTGQVDVGRQDEIAGGRAALEAGKRVALANKETLVAAGALVVPAALRSGRRGTSRRPAPC